MVSLTIHNCMVSDMEPLIALSLITLGSRLLGVLGVGRLRPWPVAVRLGLAAMFTMTGISHFIGMRETLVLMAPTWVPHPDLAVTITGILELAGAVGLMFRPTTQLAAACLGLMLLAMFPANVEYALNGGAGADALLPRTLIQAVFFGATVFVFVDEYKRHRLRKAVEREVCAGRYGASSG